MHDASQEQVVGILKNELPLLAGCLYKAWDTYNNYPKELKVHHTPRSRASLIHDHAVAYAMECFESRIGSSCHMINKLFIVAFSHGIAVRFKKLDECLRASNIATQQSIDFMSQVPLPAIDIPINLHVGYKLNQLETDIEGIYITQPTSAYSNAWFFELEYDRSAAISATVSSITTPSPSGSRVVKFIPRRKDQGNEAAQ